MEVTIPLIIASAMDGGVLETENALERGISWELKNLFILAQWE